MDIVLKKNNKIFIILFFTVIIISQAMREYIYNNLSVNLNYLIVPIILLLYFFKNKTIKINKINLGIVLLITYIYALGFIFGQYNFVIFIRGLLSFIVPLYLLIIDYKNFNMKSIIKIIIEIYNYFIYFAFLFVVIGIVSGKLKIATGGIIGHSLTAGWYYVVFISLNILKSIYYKKKKNIYIFFDIAIFVVGTLFSTGRVSIILGSILSVVYVLKCCQGWKIKYLVLPVIIILFIMSPAFNNIILEKFRYAISYGDFTNGRLLGLREIRDFSFYPSILIGGGIGYSNYVSMDIFRTINFENPLVMFMFDYGIVSVINLTLLIAVFPIYNMIKHKQYILLLNYIIISIIPFTYNGIAESTGLFFIYIIWVYVYNAFIDNNSCKDNIYVKTSLNEIHEENFEVNNIPKVIHYCWFGGNEKPKIVKKCIRTWKEKMPDYEIIEWNENNFDININRFTRDAYDSKKWAFVSDYCRLWVLYNYGGIYLDTDMEVLKSLDVFLDSKAFGGIELNDVNVAIWGCRKNDSLILEILKFYDNIVFDDYKEDLFKLAIPKIVNKVLNNKGYTITGELLKLDDGTIIYPNEYFYPKEQAWEEVNITENTYTIHHYEGSWRTPIQIYRTKLKKILVNLIGIEKANKLVKKLKSVSNIKK